MTKLTAVEPLKLGTDLSPRFLMELVGSLWNFVATRGKSKHYARSKIATATLYFKENDEEMVEDYQVTIAQDKAGRNVGAEIEFSYVGEDKRKDAFVFEIDENGAATRNPKATPGEVMEDLLAVLLVTMGDRYGKTVK